MGANLDPFLSLKDQEQKKYKVLKFMKILAVGANYTQHNNNANNSLSKAEDPIIFLKADSGLLKDRKPLFLPDDMGQIDYEAELVVRICRVGKTISPRFAHRYYDAVTVGVDFTAVEMLKECKEKGLPWDISKGFDGSAAIGEWIPTEEFAESLKGVNFHLDINGETVQRGCADNMLHKVDELIAYISRFFTLRTGDILFTGTPTGTGPIHIKDKLEGYIEDRKVLEFKVK